MKRFTALFCVCAITLSLLSLSACGCDHEFGNWMEETAATCSSEGTKVRICASCNEIEKATIPSLEHSYGDWVVTIEATCSEVGAKVRTCSVCKTSDTEETPIQHAFNDTGKCTLCGQQNAIPTPTPTHSDSPQPSSPGNTESIFFNSVTPEFKEAMDSYETFFDEYIAFMNEFSKTQNPVDLMDDYVAYMQQYAETMQKLSEVNSEHLSEADYVYYIEVTARISKKLLDIEGLDNDNASPNPVPDPDPSQPTENAPTPESEPTGPQFIGNLCSDIILSPADSPDRGMPRDVKTTFADGENILLAGKLTGVSGENTITLKWRFPDGTTLDWPISYIVNNETINLGVSDVGCGSGSVSVIFNQTGEVLATYHFTVAG